MPNPWYKRLILRHFACPAKYKSQRLHTDWTVCLFHRLRYGEALGPASRRCSL